MTATATPAPLTVSNVDRLTGWEIAHLARRYDGLADDTATDPATRDRWRQIATALRNHPQHPRTTGSHQ